MPNAKHPLKGLLIRGGAVRAADLGFLIAGDPKLEYEEIAHAISFRWKDGTFNSGKARFNINSICIIDDPEYGVVYTSDQGTYTVQTRSGTVTSNIFRDFSPPWTGARYGGISSVSTIAGKAYAVGGDGTVFRLDGMKNWARIDEGLPNSFQIQAADGFSGTDIYAVGLKGQLWQYAGQTWTSQDLPTKANLSAVRCASTGAVYTGGRGGMLLQGSGSKWSVIDHGETDDVIRGLQWFKDKLYVSTNTGVYTLEGNRLTPVDFGDDEPDTTFMLSSTKDVLWSIGRCDVMAFDGKTWTRIV
jgi:hypothetical protein